MLSYALSHTGFLILLFAFIIFALACKAYALWLAAGRREIKWFIALFILQTFAILDIIYIFFIAKNKTGESLSSAPTPTPPVA